MAEESPTPEPDHISRITFGDVQNALRESAGFRWYSQGISNVRARLTLTRGNLFASMISHGFPQRDRSYYNNIEADKTKVPQHLILLWIASTARALLLPAPEMAFLLQAYIDPSQISQKDLEKVREGQLLDPLADVMLEERLIWMRENLTTREQSKQLLEGLI